MMGKTVHKLIVLSLIFFLLGQSFLPIFAQEVTPPPSGGSTIETTPSVESPTPTPTPTDEPGVTIETMEHTSSDASASGVVINPATGVSLSNSGDELAATASSTENVAVTITNTNDIDLHKTVTDSNDTGNNTASDNITLGGTETTITTGAASSFQNILAVVNTNILASSADALLLNIFDPSYQPIDLSETSSCNAQKILNTPDILNVVNTGNSVKIIDSDALNKSTSVDNSNKAHIENTVDITATTGNNQAVDNIGYGTKVETGNATIGLNMLTVANTNLIGNCWFYGVINLFGSQNGNIILPYEYDILNSKEHQGFIFNRNQTGIINSGNDTTISTNSATNANTKINNTNSAAVNTIVNANTNTGNNVIQDAINFDTGASITTGNASSIVNIFDMLNTNIFGNRFFALRINKLGNWTGMVRGWTGNYIDAPDYLLLYNGQFPIETPTPTPDPNQTIDIVNTGDSATIDQTNANNNDISVSDNNTAHIDNTINLLADTGNNTAGKFNAHITTGNASILANIFNMANTNIIGDNWFYAVVNIFNNFVGDIIFPRPDLAVTMSADRDTVQNGDTVTFTNHIGNNGTYKADSVVVTDTIPKNATFVSASNGGVFDGTHVTWNLGTLSKLASQDVSITVRFGNNAANNEVLQNTCSALTTTQEPETANNAASFAMLFFIPSPPSQQNPNNNSTNGNGGSSSSGNTLSNNTSPNNNSILSQSFDPKYVWQWATYKYRYYNKKTKKWEVRTGRKLVKKLVKKPIIKKLAVKKSVKKVVKVASPLKLQRPKIKLRTFIDFYSAIFAQKKKNS